MLSFGIPREIVKQIVQHYDAEYVQINKERTIKERQWCHACNDTHIRRRIKNVIETVQLDGDIYTALNFRLVCKDISIAYNPLDVYKRIGGTIGSKYNCNIIKTGTRLWFKELKMIEGYVITKRYIIGWHITPIISIMFRLNKDKFQTDPTLIFDNDMISQLLRKCEDIKQIGRYGIPKKKYTASFVTNLDYNFNSKVKNDFASLYPNMVIPFPSRGEKVGMTKHLSMDFDGDEENLLINSNNTIRNDVIVKERQLLIKHGKWASTQRNRLRHIPLQRNRYQCNKK